MGKIKNALFAGLAFGLLFGLFIAVYMGIQYAIIGGIATGLLFGIMIYLFVNSKTVQQQTEIRQVEGKDILHSGGANHFINREAVGGKLYLSKQALIFKSHNFNIQNHALEIPLDQIYQVCYFNPLGIIPNGLKIVLSDRSFEKFVVSGRKKWKEEIEKCLNQ